MKISILGQPPNEALGIPTMWVVLAVPVAVAVIFFHLLAKLIGSGTGRPLDKT